jgi:pimeloyl-ACP methyl ester carboxylesterase
MSDLTSQSIRSADGRTLMYAEYGAPDGAPVFYFHGQAGSRLEPAIFDHIDLRKAGIRLVAPDRPGMGGSDFQSGRGFSHWPADVTALAEALGLARFAVVGVSGGGGYVSACARFIPERLAGAVILSGAGFMDSSTARASLPFVNRLMWGLSGRSPGLAEFMMKGVLAAPRDMSKMRGQMLKRMSPIERAFFEQPGRLEAFVASGLEAMRPGVKGIAWETHMYARPWDFRLEEICFPVRLLHGKEDNNVPLTVARQVAADIPGCQATFYPGETHLSLLANHLEEALLSLSR